MANSSSAEARQAVTQQFINKNSLNAYNESLTNMTTQSIMNSIAESGGASSQIAEIDIGKIEADGPGSVVDGINITIDQESKVTQKVILDSLSKNDINTELTKTIMNDITSKLDVDQMAKLVSNAESTQSVAGLALTGGNRVNTTTDNEMNLLVQNETTRKLTNIVNNVINQQTQTMDTKRCITTNLENAIIRIKDGISARNGGKIQNVNLSIKQTSTVINDCILKTVQNSNITSAIAEAVGLKILDETKAVQKAEGEAKSKSDQTITGLFDFTGSLIVAVLCILSIVLLCVVKMTGKK
jgi:hypothetical protein